MHGGPHGPRGPHGPHGPGPMGGGMFGPGGRAWGPGFKFPGPIRRAPGGDVASTGDYFSGVEANFTVSMYCNTKIIGKNKGSKIVGFLGATRLYTMGPLHYNIFTSRVEAATRDLAERRITEEQSKYRKLKAADKYYGYMFKVGIYTKEEFEYELKNFANEIGANGENSYIYEQVLDESNIGKSR